MTSLTGRVVDGGEVCCPGIASEPSDSPAPAAFPAGASSPCDGMSFMSLVSLVSDVASSSAGDGRSVTCRFLTGYAGPLLARAVDKR